MSLTVMLYFLISTFYFVGASTECALFYGYVYYPEVNIYYKFYKTPQTWANARLHCLNENATLVVPKNYAELNIITKILSQYPDETIVGANYRDHVHSGFQDYFIDGDFITEKEVSMQYFYREFHGGQPDSGKGERTLSIQRNGKYFDFPDANTAPFICQKEEYSYIDELSDKHLLMKNYDPAYLTAPISKKRFKLHLSPNNWDSARKICYAEGGSLAIVESKEDEIFMTNMMNDPKNKVHYAPNKDFAFIGYHDYFTEGQYLTVAGKIVNSLKYMRWAAGQPNGGVGENCGCIVLSGEIHDVICSAVAIFFCELPPIPIPEENNYAIE